MRFVLLFSEIVSERDQELLVHRLNVLEANLGVVCLKEREELHSGECMSVPSDNRSLLHAVDHLAVLFQGEEESISYLGRNVAGQSPQIPVDAAERVSHLAAAVFDIKKSLLAN